MSISSSFRSTTGFSSASTALRKIWIGCCARADVPNARTRTPARDTANASVALRQGKYVNLIVPPCRLDAGLPDEPSREQSLAGHDGDVLLSVHRVRDGAVVDRAAERRFPQNLTGDGVERPEFLIEIAPEHHVARRGQRRPVARG